MKYFAGIDVSFIKNKDETIHLLDYGSGDGRISIFFIKQGFKVTSVDIDPNSETKIISQLTDNEKRRFNFILVKEDDSFNNYKVKFDYIICREVLEHIVDYSDVVRLFSNLLNSNGTCIISVPTYFSEKIFSFIDPSWLKKCEHVNLFRNKDILNLANSNNLKLEKITSHSFSRTLFWSMVNLFRPEHRMGKILKKTRWIKFA